MAAQRAVELGLLRRFVGMLTDSRRSCRSRATNTSAACSAISWEGDGERRDPDDEALVGGWWKTCASATPDGSSASAVRRVAAADSGYHLERMARRCRAATAVLLVSIVPFLAACRRVEAPGNPAPAVRPRRRSTSTRSPRASIRTSRGRVVVLTDIANEPDDQMSMVRFLVYSNQFDIEGLVATTSTWMRTASGPTSSTRWSTPTRRCSRTC